jgi:uncharacterized protein with PIN domain/sulfur carrier protein ThiS
LAICVSFKEELNDFLPRSLRGRTIAQAHTGPRSIKDLIESLGVPHVEIAAILVDGRPVGFDHPVEDGIDITVYPRAVPGVPDACMLRPPLPREPAFVLDTHLARLAAYLRMLGFDTRHEREAEDTVIARISATEHRLLLTRDRGLLMRREVIYGYYVRQQLPRAQLTEIVERFGLADHTRPFTRCMKCNGTLVPVAREAVIARLPPRTRALHHEFRQCACCGTVYWKGSHFERMQALISSVVNQRSHIGATGDG